VQRSQHSPLSEALSIPAADELRCEPRLLLPGSSWVATL